LTVTGSWHTRTVELTADNFRLSGLLGASGSEPFEDVPADVSGIILQYGCINKLASDG